MNNFDRLLEEIGVDIARRERECERAKRRLRAREALEAVTHEAKTMVKAMGEQQRQMAKSLAALRRQQEARQREQEARQREQLRHDFEAWNARTNAAIASGELSAIESSKLDAIIGRLGPRIAAACGAGR